MRLHHVQVSIPTGGEDEGRRFYADALGLTEVAKPGVLAQRGGAWFRATDRAGAVTAEIHLGVEEPFTAARKAHPAFVVEDVAELDRLSAHLAACGFGVSHAERDTLEGYVRFHCNDPFGNRVEVLTPRVG